MNSDGNLTFTRGDIATEDRSLGRVLAGPPRAALFFADLDPSKGGGVFESSTAPPSRSPGATFPTSTTPAG